MNLQLLLIHLSFSLALVKYIMWCVPFTIFVVFTKGLVFSFFKLKEVN